MISDDSSLDMFQYCKESTAEIVEKLKVNPILSEANNIISALSQCLEKTPISSKLCEPPSTIRHFIARHISGQIFVPTYQVFGKANDQFKQHMHKYAEIYKDFLIWQQTTSSEGKQNYFVWNSDGYGMT